MNKLLASIGILAQAGLSLTPLLAQNEKTNVLFIAVDDLKPILGCYGDTLVKTPNIDRLAANGTVFLQNYCQQAVCGPTRASLLTGMRPDYTKVWDLKTKMRDVNPDILSLPQYFKQQGYETAGIGKIFDPRCVDNDLDRPSWSIPYYKESNDYYSSETGRPAAFYQSPETKALVRKYRAEGEKKGLSGSALWRYSVEKIKPSVECVDVPDNAYTDGADALHAIEIMDGLAKGKKPFFFAVGFHRPHLPFVAPSKYWDLYKRDDMPVAAFQQKAENSPDLAYHHAGELYSYSDIPPLASFSDQMVGLDLPLDKQKELIHGYYASASYTDAQVGRILDALDSLGLAKNTIIVLWGDHGWHLGDHNLWCKHTNFEQATHAPLIISAPGYKPDVSNSLSEFTDVFPTLCDLAGLAVPQQLDGKSLVPVLTDPLASVHEYAVSQYPRFRKIPDGDEAGKAAHLMGYSLRTSQYRYTVWLKDDFRSYDHYAKDLVVARELYDYSVDPEETKNVADNEKYSPVAAALNEKMVDYFALQYQKLNARH